jgi:hypothetical protein
MTQSNARIRNLGTMLGGLLDGQVDLVAAEIEKWYAPVIAAEIDAAIASQMTTGEDLPLPDPAEHDHLRTCPGCSANLAVVGLPDLAYTFETCECDRVSYTHLVQQLWHRGCLLAVANRPSAEEPA